MTGRRLGVPAVLHAWFELLDIVDDVVVVACCHIGARMLGGNSNLGYEFAVFSLLYVDRRDMPAARCKISNEIYLF